MRGVDIQIRRLPDVGRWLGWTKELALILNVTMSIHVGHLPGL